VDSWEHGRVKVCDFGLAKIVVNESMAMTKNTAGTPAYSAPELESPAHTRKVDVYSFAMIVWELASRTPAWSEVKSPWDLYRAVHDGQRPMLPPTPATPDWLCEIINACWQQDPAKRPEFAEIFDKIHEQTISRAPTGTPPPIML
jgi:serine/threonine protein kinase